MHTFNHFFIQKIYLLNNSITIVYEKYSKSIEKV